MKLAIALLPLLAVTARAQTPLVFQANVDSVYVDAFVVRDGAPVRGLGAASFELKDDGVVRPAELVRVDTVPLAAILAFDVSGSVTGETLRALRESGALFLSELAAGDQAALLTFSDAVAWSVPPTTDRAQVERGLAALQSRGGTALFDGLFAAVTVTPASARPLVVLFSDGQDSASWLDERRVKDALARSNAVVHIVGVPAGRPDQPIGERVRRVPAKEPSHVRLLRDLAGTTGGRFWPVDSTDRLRTAFADIAAAMRDRYLLRFEPAPGAKPGWHRLEVRLKNAAGEVQARPGYWAR